MLKSDGEDEGEISEEEETPAEEKKGTSIEILHMLCAINQISIVTCFSPLVHTLVFITCNFNKEPNIVANSVQGLFSYGCCSMGYREKNLSLDFTEYLFTSNEK